MASGYRVYVFFSILMNAMSASGSCRAVSSSLNWDSKLFPNTLVVVRLASNPIRLSFAFMSCHPSEEARRSAPTILYLPSVELWALQTNAPPTFGHLAEGSSPGREEGSESDPPTPEIEEGEAQVSLLWKLFLQSMKGMPPGASLSVVVRPRTNQRPPPGTHSSFLTATCHPICRPPVRCPPTRCPSRSAPSSQQPPSPSQPASWRSQPPPQPCGCTSRGCMRRGGGGGKEPNK